MLRFQFLLINISLLKLIHISKSYLMIYEFIEIVIQNKSEPKILIKSQTVIPLNSSFKLSSTIRYIIIILKVDNFISNGIYYNFFVLILCLKIINLSKKKVLLSFFTLVNDLRLHFIKGILNFKKDIFIRLKEQLKCIINNLVLIFNHLQGA